MITKLKKINYIIVTVAIFVGIILWFMMPQTVPVHYNASCVADSYGHKMVLLMEILVPLVGLIPFKAEKIEFKDPTIPEEEIKEINEYEQKKVEVIKIILSSVLGIVLLYSYIFTLVTAG